jgi:hypothetical protein
MQSDNPFIIRKHKNNEFICKASHEVSLALRQRQQKQIELRREADERRRAAGRYTLKEASKKLEVETNKSVMAKSMLNKLIEAANDGHLRVYLPEFVESYKPTNAKASYEEAYWNDLNSWLKDNEQRVDWAFPEPRKTQALREDLQTPIDADEAAEEFPSSATLVEKQELVPSVALASPTAQSTVDQLADVVQGPVEAESEDLPRSTDINEPSKELASVETSEDEPAPNLVPSPFSATPPSSANQQLEEADTQPIVTREQEPIPHIIDNPNQEDQAICASAIIQTVEKTEGADCENALTSSNGIDTEMQKTDTKNVQGKWPRTEIGKVAIRAALQIESTTGRRPTANEVITRLCEWAQTGIEAGVLSTKPYTEEGKAAIGVIWITTAKREERSYTLEKCGIALKKWYDSCDRAIAQENVVNAVESH